jgi:hypothetical protein
LSAEARLVEPQELYTLGAYTAPWFGQARSDLDHAWSVGIVTLEYLVKNRPQDRFQFVFYVCIPGYKLLGVERHRQYGF